jgi:hypothetical protein
MSRYGGHHGTVVNTPCGGWVCGWLGWAGWGSRGWIRLGPKFYIGRGPVKLGPTYTHGTFLYIGRADTRFGLQSSRLSVVLVGKL